LAAAILFPCRVTQATKRRSVNVNNKAAGYYSSSTVDIHDRKYDIAIIGEGNTAYVSDGS